MGYGYYILSDGREAGYSVVAECDHPECAARIDRGLGYLCGTDPVGWRSLGDWGCGDYFCPDHEYDHNCPGAEYQCPCGCDEEDQDDE